MPWLIGTALIHSLSVPEKRGLFKSWTVLLAIFAFSLSLLGTFMVRSGVLTSVHAFATDPARGIFILAILAVTIGGALSLYASRAPHLRGGVLFAPVSREGALVANNVLLAVSAFVVFVLSNGPQRAKEGSVANRPGSPLRRRVMIFRMWYGDWLSIRLTCIRWHLSGNH